MDTGFPLVQTSSVRSRQLVTSFGGMAVCKGADCQVDLVDCQGDPLSCATITIPTSFTLVKKEASDKCIILITHAVCPKAAPLNSSRVRIDSRSLVEVKKEGCTAASQHREWTDGNL